MVGDGPLGVQGQVELVGPAEFEAGLGEGVVAALGGGVALGQVGGVGGDLVGHHALAHIVTVGQPQVLLGGHIAQQGATVPTDHGRPDGAGQVVVPRGDVGHQRPQGVEGSLVAPFQLAVHVLANQVHGDVAGPLVHDLHVEGPGPASQVALGPQLGELGLVVGIGNAAGPQAVADAEGHVVAGHDLADLVPVGVRKVLAVMGQAPLGVDGPAAADDAGDSLGGQRHVAEQQPRVNGEVIHSLLGLLDQRVAEDLPGQLLGLAFDLLEGLVDGHRADGHRAVADDPLAGFVNVAPGGQVHGRIRSPADRPDHLLDLLVDR